jgi:hypothetical protein
MTAKNTKTLIQLTCIEPDHLEDDEEQERLLMLLESKLGYLLVEIADGTSSEVKGYLPTLIAPESVYIGGWEDYSICVEKSSLDELGYDGFWEYLIETRVLETELPCGRVIFRPEHRYRS